MSGKVVVPIRRRRARDQDDAALVARRALDRWLSDAFRHRADEIASQVDRALPQQARTFLGDFSRRHFAPGNPEP